MTKRRRPRIPSALPEGLRLFRERWPHAPRANVVGATGAEFQEWMQATAVEIIEALRRGTLERGAGKP